MKKILALLFGLLVVFGVSFASETPLYGEATGDNVTMNFSGDTSTVAVLNDQFTGNACGSNYSGFLLTGHVNREGNGYVYFSEPDGDDTVNSCVAIILSGQDFYLTGVGATDSGTGYTMKFNNIKLNYSTTDKVYYFSGTAIDDALGSVPNWGSVYVSGLNLIDWSKTLVDYASLTGGNYIANGLSTGVNLVLLDIAGNPVVTLDNITVNISSTSSNLSGYSFLGTGGETSINLPVDNGIVNIPLYIIKAVSDGSITLKFDYSVIDADGNNSHTITLSNINVKQPEINVSLGNISTPIVGENSEVSLSSSFVNTGNISDWIFDGNITTTYPYTLSTGTIAAKTGFDFKIVPNDVNNTYSIVTGALNISSYTVKYADFGGKQVTYTISKSVGLTYYADKNVDNALSFTGFNVSGSFTGGALTGTLNFKPILRDKHGYKIPDVKYDIKIYDNGPADSYESWDCDEIAGGYQDGCNPVVFGFNNRLFSGTVNSVNGADFSYNVTGNDYLPINVISFKPVSGANLKFDLSNLENTSSDWNNLSNSGDWLSINNMSGDISNIIFTPYLTFRLRGLDDQLNYVDVNNQLYLEANDNSSFGLNSSFDLSGLVVEPDHGVTFATGGKITNSLSLTAGENKLLPKDIMFDVTFAYASGIKFKYDGYYNLTPSFNGVGTMKLKPWYFWFNLGGTYKIGGVYVNGLVSKVQKYSTSVKNYLGKRGTMVTSFSNVYNKLKKKVYSILQGLSPENNLQLKIGDLDGGVKYYSCTDKNGVLDVVGGTYNGNNLIIVKNCKVFIQGDIEKGNSYDSLVIFAFNSLGSSLDNITYLDGPSNIYISPNVSDINAGLITKGSIFTLNADNLTNLDVDNGNIYKDNRIYSSGLLQHQLFINGMLIAQNNVGGSFLTDGHMVIGASKRLTQSVIENAGMWGKKGLSQVRNIAQVFDLNFMRGYNYSSGTNSIDSTWYSEYCKNHSNESGCKYPVYIKYDPSVKRNLLFK